MKTLFAYISILSLVLPCAALAQVDGEDSAQSMEEVVVSGQFLYSDTVNALKTPTPILDVPQSLSLMTADESVTAGSTVSVKSWLICRA